MKKNILILALLALFLVPSYNIQAQEEANEEDAGNQVTENLKKRLQETLQGSDQNIVSTNELPTSPRAFVGTVEDIIQETITIITKDGAQYVTTDEDTTILRSPGNKIIDAEDIQIDDFMIAMGYLETTNKLRSKRIIVSTSISGELAKTSGRGTIDSLDSDTITITTPDANDPLEIYLDSYTVTKNRSEVIDTDDLNVGDSIIYTADVDDDELTATIIMVIQSSSQENQESLTDEE